MMIYYARVTAALVKKKNTQNNNEVYAKTEVLKYNKNVGKNYSYTESWTAYDSVHLSSVYTDYIFSIFGKYTKHFTGSTFLNVR